MKIATRNLAGAKYAGNRFRSADAQARSLDDAISTGADVLLLQEVARLGSDLQAPPGWNAQPASPSSDWGSVVYVRDGFDVDLSWRPDHPVIEAFGSYLDFARLTDSTSGELALISVHAPPGWSVSTWAATENSGPMPDRGRPWTSDVLLDVLVEAVGDRSAVLAGDWNEAPNYPSETAAGTVEFFARAKRHGLIEAVDNAFDGPVRTNFTSSARTAYQNDHVFLKGTIQDRLRSVAVWNEVAPRLSDHAGILVSLDLERHRSEGCGPTTDSSE